MIIRDKSWHALLFSVHGSVLSQIWGRLLVTVAAAIGATVLFEMGLLKLSITIVPFSLVGLALGIFLGFRNNTSYDRFWEGRKLWGRMVNTSRSFARQVRSLVGPQPSDEALDEDAAKELEELQRELVYRQIAYVHALRMHLRDEWKPDELSEMLPAEELAALNDEHNRPIAMLKTVGLRLREVWRRGWVNDYHLSLLENTLTDLTDIQGACERIKSTPIPYSYTVLIHRLVASYCFALPFGIVDSVHLLTPVVVLMISYAFFGLDAIGDEIESPFGHDHNDLPLSTLSRMIEVNLRQTLGETELPPLLTGDHHGYLD